MSRPAGSLLILVTLLASVQSAFGFGQNGHRVVGRIAEKHLSSEAKAAIGEILGAETLAQAATWPDEIRSDPDFRSTGPWHYVTIEDGLTYESSLKSDKGDVVVKIGDFVEALEDPETPLKDKVVALRWLVHLVGDVHQPLHVGRGADRGGNLIETKWFGKETNMHKIWDSEMIDSAQLSFSELATFSDQASPEQVRAWQESTVLDWVQESIDYRTQVYTVPMSGSSGSYVYSYLNFPLVKLRMHQAGVRVAALLNGIFD